MFEKDCILDRAYYSDEVKCKI